MALKLTLKPGERFVINGAVLENGDRRSTLTIENQASVLRERDIMQPEDALTPMRRIYFAIMMQYLDEESSGQYRQEFAVRLGEFMEAISNPEALRTCVDIIQLVEAKQYYKALLAAKSLYEFEEARLNYVSSSLPASPEHH
ncbi:MAG: flagellar biosynthesis repressor FlbT [Alphaproteobacteria bacterium]